MNNKYLEIRKQAQTILSEMSIMDGDAVLNNLLFELSETDDSDIELKLQTLEEIKKLLNIKNKLKVKNDDFYYLRNIAEQLRLESDRDLMNSSLIKVVYNEDEHYFISNNTANEYISSLTNKDNVIVSTIKCEKIGKLLNIIKHNF